MPNLIFIHDTNREEAINIDLVRRVRAIRSKVSGVVGLEITYLGETKEMYYSERARELWIALGMSEWITDGDGCALRLKTPFGEKDVI